MSQSLVRNYIHIVFSTKYRQPLIIPPFEDQLHNYLGGICKNLECQPIKVGGYVDHIHILCLLSKKLPLMTLVKELKHGSSLWVKTLDVSMKNFYWQNGYGAFSVRPCEADTVISYIANQHAHHARVSFKEEYRGILKKEGVEFDERYVWD